MLKVCILASFAPQSLRRGLPHNNQVQELGIAYHIGGHGAQFLQGASGGAGHNQGVKAPLPGVVDNFRAGAAPQQFGADCPTGRRAAKVSSSWAALRATVPG